MKIEADLHIHSCLSPCGDLEMSPSAIAAKAASLGLSAAALTDHNSAGNAPAFSICCRREGILPVFGLEVTSAEEAHILCLFGTPEEALEMGRIVSLNYPEVPNIPEKFGDQVIVDHEDFITGEAELYLLSASALSLEEIMTETFKLGGLFIPAHIDKPVFSIPSQLGFLPDMEYSALETTVLPCPVDGRGKTFIRNSDAHYIHDIGCRTTLYEVESLCFEAVKKAISRGLAVPGR